MTNRFFVCYSHQDDALIREEITWLREEGFDIWYDQQIQVGAIWRSEIVRAINDTDGLIYFSSKDSVTSEHCIREINYALDLDKPIVVVQLDDTEIPDFLKLSFNHRQALLRHSFATDAFRSRLIDALRWKQNPQPRQPAPRISSEPPVLVVLPMVPLGDQSVTVLAQQITSSLISRMTKRIWQVVSGKPDDLTKSSEQLSSEHSASYVLSCELAGDGQRYRLTTHLRETTTGREVSSQRYDQDGNLGFDAQDELVSAIDDETFEAFIRAEGERAKNAPEELLNAWALSVLAWQPLVDHESTTRVKSLLESALKLEPEYALAHCLYGLKLGQSIYSLHSQDPESDAKLAIKHAERALLLDPDTTYIISTAAVVHRMVGDLEYAALLAERASRSTGRYEHAELEVTIQRGDFEKAYQMGGEMEYSRFLPSHMAITCLVLGKHEEAVNWSRRGTATDPDRYNNWACLAAAYAQLDQAEEAAQSWQRACTLSSTFTVERFDQGMRLAWRGRDDIATALTSGLKKLGLT